MPSPHHEYMLHGVHGNSAIHRVQKSMPLMRVVDERAGVKLTITLVVNIKSLVSKYHCFGNESTCTVLE